LASQYRLLIAALAFVRPEVLATTKLSILGTWLIAGCAGVLLRRETPVV
jgi:hypothetical protein